MVTAINLPHVTFHRETDEVTMPIPNVFVHVGRYVIFTALCDM